MPTFATLLATYVPLRVSMSLRMSLRARITRACDENKCAQGVYQREECVSVYVRVVFCVHLHEESMYIRRREKRAAYMQGVRHLCCAR